MATPVAAAIALDLGTTAIKAGVINERCELSAIYALPAPEMTVKAGRYESDALDYLKITEQLLQKCLSDTHKTLSVGIAYQRSSFLVWERFTGQPVTRLISWQDNRGKSTCVALHSMSPMIQQLTGLRLTPYYFAPKINKLFQEQPELRRGLEKGSLLVGTLDSFLLWHWSGGKYYQTDVSMAARTLLMDVRQQQWSSDLCEIFTISPQTLPEIRPSTGLNQTIIHGAILQASIADQSAALIASVSNEADDVLVNLGTGGFVIRYLPERQLTHTDHYLCMPVYQDVCRNTFYAIEGTLNAIASALAPYPFKDCQIDELAMFSQIFCLAEPAGIGAPYFKPDLGMVFSEPVEELTPHQIAGLLLEGIIFRVARILEEFHQKYGIQTVILSGGLSDLTCLQQGIAQCQPVEVHRLVQKESTLLGAGLMALGMTSSCQRKTEPVQITCRNYALTEKFQSWKKWFDQLLGE